MDEQPQRRWTSDADTRSYPQSAQRSVQTCLPSAYDSAGIAAHCRNSFSDNHSALTERRCNHQLTIEYEVVKRGLGDESDRASS